MRVTRDAAAELARRLRSLREHHWPHQTITQGQLAEVFGGRKPLSIALISSWESTTSPRTPPTHRLEAYARLFATERSLVDDSLQLLDLADLTPAERQRRDHLLDELTALREAAQSGAQVATPVVPQRGLLHYPPNEDITIVCGQMPRDQRPDRPYTDPGDPDYDEFYTFADPRALLEIYGHLCAANPRNRVRYRVATEMRSDHYSTHLVLIGGVDWNDVAHDLFRERISIPVRQLERETVDDVGTFEVTEDGQTRTFTSTLLDVGGRRQLASDVVHIYRGPNPYNMARTVTLFNGNYARGTLGAVRALIDSRFRERNDEYRRTRFGGTDQFSVLTRVAIVNGKVIPPDWSVAENRLHEWSGVRVGGERQIPTDSQSSRFTPHPAD